MLSAINVTVSPGGVGGQWRGLRAAKHWHVRPQIDRAPTSPRQMSSQRWESGLNHLAATEIEEFDRRYEVRVAGDQDRYIVRIFPCQADHGRHDCRIHALFHRSPQIVATGGADRDRSLARWTFGWVASPPLLDFNLNASLPVEPCCQPSMKGCVRTGIVGGEYMCPFERIISDAGDLGALSCQPTGQLGPVASECRLQVVEAEGQVPEVYEDSDPSFAGGRTWSTARGYGRKAFL